MKHQTIQPQNDTNLLLSTVLPAILCYGPSVRALENSVALGLEKLDTAELPKLERDESFYGSILPEIKDKERSRYNTLNQAKKNVLNPLLCQHGSASALARCVAKAGGLQAMCAVCG